ncbi:hypothetical protein C1N68_26500 (plasmid) [Priestia aryabhattai]
MKKFRSYLPLLFIIIGIVCLVFASNTLYMDKHILRALTGIIILTFFPALFLFIYQKIRKKN